MGLPSSDSKGGTGGRWEKRMRGQGRERGMEREGGYHRFAILQQGDGG